MLLCIVMICAVANGMAQHTPASAKKKKAAGPVVYAGNLNVNEHALLSKLQALNQVYGKITNNFTVKGTMTMTDGDNPGTNVNQIPFEYCVKGNELYYRTGEVETINRQGCYLIIDHVGKRVLISQQKKLVNQLAMPSVKDMINALNTQHYQLSGRSAGGIQTVTLSNEHHISCKEITVAYDTVSLRITHLYYRYTNLSEPTDRSREKAVSVDISHWNGKADMGAYLKPAEVAYATARGWRLHKKYQNYQLIVT